ncbi:uncharacterized protein LOC114952157 isoform X2 [Acropora millepora]|uniref:uncharacterized protein LOC114952157 isoform X2 n=1 Tax=Acropora millepora TaxID=45264 RepID=UPI001CF20654|nr:uncharacterized protein LOC114952157 isoform X2 [Acropora millepora]
MATRGSSFPGTSGSLSQEATEGCESLISSRKLKVTLLGSEWGSTKGGLSTFNRELAIHLAKNDNVEVSMYLPQCSEKDKRAATKFRVDLLEAEKKLACDPIEWLASVPREHCMDVVIGHGIHLGQQVPRIKELHPNCKWIQFVHTDAEELGMSKEYPCPIVKGEKKHEAEVELCEWADQVAAVGPKLSETFARYLRSSGKDQDIINFTPGIFSEFSNIKQAAEEGGTFHVLVFGRGDKEDFHVKGYDIAARAVAKLKDEERSFKLVFVGAPDGEEDEVMKRFLNEGISLSQLIVRSAKGREQLAKQFCQADLVIMPSRTEGFGLAALEALSAGLPVLVSDNSGIGKALKEVPYGSNCVVNLEFNDTDPMKWAEAIKGVCRKERKVRLKEAILLHQSYAATYQWEEQCSTLVEKMLEMIKETSTVPDEVLSAVKLGGQGPSSVSEAVLHPDLTTIQQQIVGDVVSSGRENETPTAPHQAVAANNLAHQGVSAIPETPETEQQHILDDVVTSGSENGSQDVRHGASGVQQLRLREYGESYVKVLIDSNNGLKERKKKVVEEFLIKTVQSYLEFNARSGDNDKQAMISLTTHLISAYWLHLDTVGLGSIFISLECPTLDSLEHLWSDYLTGHLHMLTERYLVPDEVKEKLKLEGNILKTTIEEQNYLNCKKALVDLRSTYSAVIDNSSVIQWLKGEYNRRAEFSPLLWSKGVKLQLKDLYGRLSVVSSRYSKRSEIGVNDIFSSSRKGEDSMVLLEGYPGIGKSFFCLKLAQDWANGAMPSTFPIFELVLLLKCKDIEGHIMDAISEQLLPRSLEDKMKDNFLKFIGDVSNQERILVILDGCNELPEESKHHVDNVLARRVLKCCYVMVTTRQRPDLWKPFKFDSCLEMKAFSEDDSFDYIRNHFKNTETEESSKGERLIELIKRNRLLQGFLSDRPNLLLLCLLYEDHEGQLPSSSSDLYQAFVRSLLRRFCAKQKLKTNEEDMDLTKQFEREILPIGELAWKSLLNCRHSFREDDLKLERRDEMSITLGLGFVYKEESFKRSEPHHVFTFVHKTFQDYLAALYVAHNLRGSKFYEPVRNQFIFGQWYRKAFLFVCGILREEASILFRQIGDALQKDWDWSKCSKDAASFFTETWKESGNAESMANTLCSVLPFPRVLHVSQRCYEEFINVLEECAGFSKVQTPAEVHVAVSPRLQDVKNIQRVLAGVPNVKTLILPAVRYSIDRAEVGEVLRASKTLETVTFTLSTGRGQGWASALDVGLSADSSLSSVGLRIYGVLNQSALQAVENLLFNKCLSSLSIAMYGDVQKSLAKALAGGLAGNSAVKFLDLCVNGKLSFDGACSLEEGILRNGSLRNVKISVNGELPVNWQGVGENLHAKLAKKGVVSSIYPNIFSKVKGSQVTRLNRMLLSKTHLVQRNVTLNIWGELTGDASKAVCEVLLHTPVSHLTLNIHGQLTDEILRCTARYAKEQKKPSSITINTWVQMTEKEKNLINELGLDKNPSVSLNVCETGAPLREASDSEVISSYEQSDLFAFFEKPGKVSSKSPDTSQFSHYELRHRLKTVTSLNSLTLAINIYSDTDSLWAWKLRKALEERTSLNSLTLAINIYSDIDSRWIYKLGEALAKCTSLNSLTLAINIYSDGDSQWGHEFLDGLEKIKSSTECNFTFNICGK